MNESDFEMKKKRYVRNNDYESDVKREKKSDKKKFWLYKLYKL